MTETGLKTPRKFEFGVAHNTKQPRKWCAYVASIPTFRDLRFGPERDSHGEALADVDALKADAEKLASVTDRQPIEWEAAK